MTDSEKLDYLIKEVSDIKKSLDYMKPAKNRIESTLEIVQGRLLS